jgi:hypothetical protein
MKTVDITELAYRNGTEAAHHFWQLDPAEYDAAVEWVRSFGAGTIHDYDLPGPFDEMPADLNTEGWSWGDLAEYGTAWEQAYIWETAKLCGQVIAEHERDNNA